MVLIEAFASGRRRSSDAQATLGHIMKQGYYQTFCTQGPCLSTDEQ